MSVDCYGCGDLNNVSICHGCSAATPASRREQLSVEESERRGSLCSGCQERRQRGLKLPNEFTDDAFVRALDAAIKYDPAADATGGITRAMLTEALELMPKSRGEPVLIADEGHPMPNYIPIVDLKHGYLYQVSGRNITFGIWDVTQSCFVGRMHGFAGDHLSSEYHRDFPACGIALAIREIEPARICHHTEATLIYLEEVEAREFIPKLQGATP
jgi:hypothetical protein